MENAGSTALLLTVITIIYFIPTIVAFLRDHINLMSITATNILLGWTVLGWIVALIWSLSSQIKENNENKAP